MSNSPEHTLAEVFPPGDFIREELEGRGWGISDLAMILDRPIQTVSELVNGKKAITPTTAHELGEAFGTGPEVWLNLESMWQLSQASPPQGKVRERAAVYELAPVREMIRRRWIAKVDSPDDVARQLRLHYGVDDLSTTPQLQAAARSSVQGELNPFTPAQWAWMCRCRNVSTRVFASKFRRQSLTDCIPYVRALASDPEELRNVPKVLAEAGIRLVVVEHLKGTKLDGGALRRNDPEPVIGLSLRYGRIDNFWHTLMHELAHIVFGDGVNADSDIQQCGRSVDMIEMRANKQAAEWLVPREELQSFIRRTSPLYTTRKIANFSTRLGVHPAIVAGQLKFLGELDWGQFHRMHIDVRDRVRSCTIADGWGEPIML